MRFSGAPLHPRLIESLRFRSLMTFATVVEAGGIVRAAKRLGVAQPSVSRTIRELEVLVESELFHKVGRRVELTEAGAALYEHVQRLLAELRSTAEQLDVAAAHGFVRVGILVAAAAQLVPHAIIELQRTHPKMTISLFEASADGLLTALAAGEVDLVAGRVFDLDREMGFRHEILYDEPTVLCGRAEHPAFKAHSKSAVKLKEIAAYPWILPPPTVTLRREIETALSAMPGVKPPLIVESMSVLANRTLLLHTDMLTFTAPTVVAESVADGSLVTRRLPFAFKPAPIGITSRADHDLQPAAVLFVDALRGAARAIRNGKGISLTVA